MKAPLLLLIAFTLPIVIGVLMIGPVYAGIFSAIYYIYDPVGAGANPAMQIWSDFFKVIDTYADLMGYWNEHKEQVDFLSFTLPLFGFPALGAFITMFAAYFFISYLINMFRMSTSY